MTIEKKLLGTNPVDGAVTVEDVFSTYVYTGNGDVNTINNGIDLSGEGGLVWFKDRTFANGVDHILVDSERGKDSYLGSNTTDAAIASTDVCEFNSTGFDLTNFLYNNGNTRSFASWTFRKARKFFDVVTYTGTDLTRTIPHALNGPVGTIFVKCTSTNGTNWVVYHKNLLATQELYLNQVSAKSNNNRFGVAPTDTVFTVSGSDPDINGNGLTYVAYLFADNTAEDADEQMIKCGSVTGNSSDTQDINLGWEAQYVLYKSTSVSGGWYIWDSMRGFLGGANNGDGHPLYADATGPEFNNDDAGLLPTGFQVADAFNTNGATYIYIAIRAPMMKEPSVATDVFKPTSYTGAGAGTQVDNGFPADLQITNNTDSTANGSKAVFDRLRGGGRRDLLTNTTAPETNGPSYNQNFNKYQNIIESIGSSGYTSVSGKPYISYAFKRAKGFMDCVAYNGTGANRTVAHSLGVVPEMIWVKCRSTGYGWHVYSEALGNTKYLKLADGDGTSTASTSWNNTSPTASVFTVGTGAEVNTNTATYVAYLFASVAGISKVGSYTGNGTTQFVDCGFSAGARFVLIKRTDATGDWYVFDTVRGITTGDDPHLSLNTTAPEVTNDNVLHPYSAGFAALQYSNTNINVSTATYIFYAIA